MSAIGNLSSEALKRKERLKALKDRHRVKNTEGGEREETEDSVERLPKPIFRSYKPQDENLQDAVLPKIKPLDVKSKVDEHLGSQKTEHSVEDIDLTTLAPRKPDWDLKRDIKEKLDKLERRTQRAIAEIIRERLKEGNEDLAQVVNSTTVNVESESDED